MTTPRTIQEVALLEIASALMKQAMLSKAPAQAREALELRSLLYGTAAKLSTPRQIQILFAVGRSQSGNTQLQRLCRNLV